MATAGFPLIYSNGGIPITIYTTSGGGERPIHGAYKYGAAWHPVTWGKDGVYHAQKQRGALDITNAITSGKIKISEKQPTP